MQVDMYTTAQNTEVWQI